MATSSETLTSTFIEAALNVHRNMLGDSKCMHQLQAMDEQWSPTPLNSIYKLQILVAKSGNAAAYDHGLFALHQ